MDIIAQLNSGKLHAAARAKRPDCVDSKGGIHRSPERAKFVSWFIEAAEQNGPSVERWSAEAQAEYRNRYVPS